MDKLKPTVLFSQVDYENPRFRVLHDHLQWPNGHKGEYFIIEGAPFVIILAVRDSQIAVVRQYRYTVDRVTIEFPKGGIEAGESPEQAALRELREEAAYVADRLELLATLACSIGNTRKQCYVFLAQDLSPSPEAAHRDATEHDMCCTWIQIDAFRSQIRSGEIIDQDSLAAWGIYQT